MEEYMHHGSSKQEELKKLFFLAQEIMSGASMPALLQEIVEFILPHVDASSALVTRWNSRTNFFIPVMGIGHVSDDTVLSELAFILPPQALLSSELKAVPPDSLPANSDTALFVGHLKESGINSCAALPLATRGNTLGAIIFFRSLPSGDIFKNHSTFARALVQFQAMASLIFENIILSEESQRRESRLSTLYEISQRAKATIDPRDTLNSMVDMVRSIVDYDMCALYVLAGDESGRLIAKTWRGINPAQLWGATVKTGEGPIGEVAASGKPKLSHHGDFKSYAAVPVIMGEKIIGVLVIGSKKSYAYDDEDIMAVNILSAQIASIENMIGALVEMRANTEWLIESMTSGIIILDGEGTVTTFNSSASHILRLPPMAPVGKDYRTGLASHPHILKILDGTFRTGIVYENFEISDPELQVPLEVTCFPIRDGSGKTLGVAMFFRDVTKEKKLEEKLRRADRLSALGEMAACVAHEIRNPLAGIRMSAQLVRRDVVPDSESYRTLTNLIGETDRLNSIITSLLDFARPRPLQFVSLDLTETLENALFFLKSDLESHSITLIREFTSPSPVISADANQIKQVIFNIVKNSIESMKNGGVLKIKTETDSEKVYISFTDTGSGIEPDHIKHIFQPFFTTRATGTGLGLPISQRIVEDHGGTIDVSSTPGQGTTFRIALPLEQSSRTRHG